MGPSPESDGKVVLDKCARKGCAASMGPSPESDGKETAAAREAEAQLASMGPSPESDGKLSRENTTAFLSLASMGPSPESDGKLAPLLPKALRDGSFNGAVARERRKVRISGHREREDRTVVNGRIGPS